MSIICHIVGLVNKHKIDFTKELISLDYNIIDLDDFSNIILKNTTMMNMYKQYYNFKETKNDKYKEIDKKMAMYWEATMEEMISTNINKIKKNIIIGYSHHFRNITKRLNLARFNPKMNKFIIKVSKQDVKYVISNNLDKYRNDIINGSYPLENIDFDFIYKNRMKIDETYEKNGYQAKDIETINTILKMHKTKIDTKGLWLASSIPYNVSSMIHPNKRNKIYAFTDMMYALISSFNFNDDELEKTYDSDGNIHIVPKKDNVLERMKDKRYLYFVEKNGFIPHEKGNNIKYYTQNPVMVLDMKKINNVFNEYFK